MKQYKILNLEHLINLISNNRVAVLKISNDSVVIRYKNAVIDLIKVDDTFTLITTNLETMKTEKVKISGSSGSRLMYAAHQDSYHLDRISSFLEDCHSVRRSYDVEMGEYTPEQIDLQRLSRSCKRLIPVTELSSDQIRDIRVDRRRRGRCMSGSEIQSTWRDVLELFGDHIDPDISIDDLFQTRSEPVLPLQEGPSVQRGGDRYLTTDFTTDQLVNLSQMYSEQIHREFLAQMSGGWNGGRNIEFRRSPELVELGGTAISCIDWNGLM